MGWFVFVAILFGMWRLKMARTLLTLWCIVYSSILIALAFFLGAFLTMVFDNESIRQWYLIPSWVSGIVDSEWFGRNYWIVFFLPLIFVFDCVRWIWHISLFQGNIFLWIMMALGLWGAGRVWYFSWTSFFKSRELWSPPGTTWDWFGRGHVPPNTNLTSEQRWVKQVREGGSSLVPPDDLPYSERQRLYDLGFNRIRKD